MEFVSKNFFASSAEANFPIKFREGWLLISLKVANRRVELSSTIIQFKVIGAVLSVVIDYNYTKNIPIKLLKHRLTSKIKWN